MTLYMISIPDSLFIDIYLVKVTVFGIWLFVTNDNGQLYRGLGKNACIALSDVLKYEIS